MPTRYEVAILFPAPMPPPLLDVRDLHVTLGGNAVLKGVGLSLEPGRCLVLLGPSGCGKSTLLRAIAGLETPDSGSILIDGRDVTRDDPASRDVAMVFQDYALYPHLTVAENLAFGAQARKVDPATIQRRVADVAARLLLDRVLDRKPVALSGGQRQRVAMGRALVRRPKLFLLDEPLSNLDARLRGELRALIRTLILETGIPAVHVTHDQVEAMTMGDTVVVLNGGRVEQAGPPDALYAHPRTAFVAGFMGQPPMNLLRGTVRDGVFSSEGFTLPVPFENGDCTIGIRPEALAVVEVGDVAAPVSLVERLGHEDLVHVSVGGSTWLVRTPPGTVKSGRPEVRLGISRDALHHFPS